MTDVAKIAAGLTKAQREGWKAAEEYRRGRMKTAHGSLWRIGAAGVGMYAGAVAILVPWMAYQGLLLKPRAWDYWAFSLVALVPALLMWRQANKLDRAQCEAFWAKWHAVRNHLKETKDAD
jgi:cystathionine beta-lyase family protein involved in aluminum resistance